MAQPGMIQIGEGAGFPVHENSLQRWRGIFEAMHVSRGFACLTRGQTARSGLSVCAGEEPEAVMQRFDDAIELLLLLTDMLEVGRKRLEIAMSGTR